MRLHLRLVLFRNLIAELCGPCVHVLGHAGWVRPGGWPCAQVAGVRVTLFAHSMAHGTPDAVFPNNWVTTHAAGEAGGGVAERTLVLYPLKCPNRWAPHAPHLPTASLDGPVC